MKKIKASQAKINSDAAKSTHDDKVLADIYKKIEEASLKGLYTISYNGDVSLEVQDKLRLDGYLVSSGGGRHAELGVDITWTAPSN